jgi:hypothetical protein
MSIAEVAAMRGKQFMFQISASEVERIKALLPSLHYASIQHWLLDMIRATIMDEIDFSVWKPRANNMRVFEQISVNLPEEYFKLADKAIHDAGFYKKVDWCLACMDWTIRNVERSV